MPTTVVVILTGSISTSYDVTSIVQNSKAGFCVYSLGLWVSAVRGTLGFWHCAVPGVYPYEGDVTSAMNVPHSVNKTPSDGLGLRVRAY